MFSAYSLSQRKTKKTISLIHAGLYGAVLMNNSVFSRFILLDIQISLGVFLAMILFRDLAWTFSAETLTISIVMIVVGIFGSLRSTIQTIHVLWILSIYPLSIVLVALLESGIVGWN